MYIYIPGYIQFEASDIEATRQEDRVKNVIIFTGYFSLLL